VLAIPSLGGRCDVDDYNMHARLVDVISLRRTICRRHKRKKEKLRENRRDPVFYFGDKPSENVGIEMISKLIKSDLIFFVG